MSEKTYKGLYLILSLKWSEGKDHLVWWQTDNSGYTPDIDKAGRYTAEQVSKQPSYYDNESTTRAVPLYDVLEGFVGPIQRIIASSYIRPRNTYECHACMGTIEIDPRFSPLSCRKCRAYICNICYDEGICVEAGSASGRHPAQETGA